jgi:hypothetical protein
MATNDSARSTNPGDDPICAATGRGMQEWAWLLDRWNGDKSTEETVIRYLVMQHKLPSFWAQAIAKRYRTTGPENQRAEGQP